MVIYLTGAPASGKSSLCTNLLHQVDKLIYFQYGEELAKLIAHSTSSSISQVTLRKKSSILIRPSYIEELDRKLLKLVKQNRRTKNIIIDSHAVTKEFYGFRVLPFSAQKLAELKPDIIVVLYCNSSTTINRIKKKSAGRPLITNYEATMHNEL